MNKGRAWVAWAIAVIYLCALYFLLFQCHQKQGDRIVLGFSVAFSAASLLAFKGTLFSRQLRYLPFLAALLPIFSVPTLSDDVYRFLWDGYLLLDGYDPFDKVPAALIKSLDKQPYLQLYPRLNSPNYHSVYPPVSQLLFLIAASLERMGANAIMVMKIFYAIIHLIALLVFEKSTLGQRYPGFYPAYGLNPLVVVEGIGNLHAEPLMVAFLIFAAVWFERKKRMGSALFFALAVSTKLLPLMFLPLLFYGKFKEQKRWFFFIALFCLLLFVPFFMAFASGGFFQSIDLYYRKFEFNAGLYYLLRFIGQWATGYNLIQWLGPGLALVALSTILYISVNVKKWLEKGYDLKEVGLWIVLAYLFSLTTLHPWYLILPLAVSLCTQYKSLWIWSYLITWTYQSYQIPKFAENYGLVFLEYAVFTCILVWELSLFLRGNQNRHLTLLKSENKAGEKG